MGSLYYIYLIEKRKTALKKRQLNNFTLYPIISKHNCCLTTQIKNKLCSKLLLVHQLLHGYTIYGYLPRIYMYTFILNGITMCMNLVRARSDCILVFQDSIITKVMVSRLMVKELLVLEYEQSLRQSFSYALSPYPVIITVLTIVAH